MEILGQLNLQEKLQSFQQHAEYRKILAVLLKYQIQNLVQQLAQTGEESVLMTLSVSDGAMSVIGSDSGEKFMQNQDTSITTDFMKQFVQFCNGAASPTMEDSKHGIKLTQNLRVEPETKKPFPVTDKLYQKPVVSIPNLFRSRKSQRKKPVDKTDETVTALVNTIMKVGRQKEFRAVNCLPLKTEEQGRERKSGRHERKTVDHKTIYNSNFDKTIDTKVSQLVQTIKAEAEAKEKRKFSRDYMYRKRRNSDTHLDILSDDNSNCSTPRKKARSIADCFPKIPSNVVSSHSDSSSDYTLQTIIKVEPVTEGYEDTVTDRDESSKQNGMKSPEIVIENVGTINETDFNNSAVSNDVAGDHSITDADLLNSDGSKVCINANGDVVMDGTGSSMDDSGTSVVEVMMENDIKEEELELPFVEEFYKRRGDVTLKDEETSDDPDILYRSSLRKPGKYNLVHRGYTYIRDKVGKGNTVYWKCGRLLCRGRVIQRNGENIRTKDHNHPPTIDSEAFKVLHASSKHEMSMEDLR